MTDLCRQCVAECYGEDGSDFKNVAAIGKPARVLCEGCGVTLIDADGYCVSPKCLRHGVHPSDNNFVMEYAHPIMTY